jgi:uncharacterized protein (DUF1778 family)
MPDETKNRPGPVPRDEATLRWKRVSVPVNKEEQALIKSAASTAGNDVAGWARMILLKASKESQAPAPEQK